MNRIDLSIPQLGFVIATRAALGAGIGLLLSQKLARKQSRTVGLALVAFGALTTIPAILAIRGSVRKPLWKAA